MAEKPSKVKCLFVVNKTTIHLIFVTLTKARTRSCKEAEAGKAIIYNIKEKRKNEKKNATMSSQKTLKKRHLSIIEISRYGSFKKLANNSDHITRVLCIVALLKHCFNDMINKRFLAAK